MLVRIAFQRVLVLSVAAVGVMQTPLVSTATEPTRSLNDRPENRDTADGAPKSMNILDFCRLPIALHYPEICLHLGHPPVPPRPEVQVEDQLRDDVIWGGLSGVLPPTDLPPPGVTATHADPKWIVFEPQMTVTILRPEDLIVHAATQDTTATVPQPENTSGMTTVPDPTVTICRAVRPTLAKLNRLGTLTRYSWASTVTELVRYSCPSYCAPSLALETFNIGGHGPVARFTATTTILLAETTTTLAMCHSPSRLTVGPDETGLTHTTHTVTSSIPLVGSPLSVTAEPSPI